jgi:hypothetical protein
MARRPLARAFDRSPRLAAERFCNCSIEGREVFFGSFCQNEGLPQNGLMSYIADQAFRSDLLSSLLRRNAAACRRTIKSAMNSLCRYAEAITDNCIKLAMKSHGGIT